MSRLSTISAVISATAITMLSACASGGQSTPALPQAAQAQAPTQTRTIAKLKGALGSEQVVHIFGGAADGGQSTANLIVDASGNLYGTAAKGGRANAGVVFEFSRNKKTGWKETILHAFSGGKDGRAPLAGLTMDSSGNVYGTTSVGGNSACTTSATGPCGVVFELTPTGNGKWNETVLHAFSGKDGAFPVSGITLDKSGNVFGTTEEGGSDTTACVGGCGVAFELARGGSQWTETVLHTFAPTHGTDGEFPQSRPIFDKSGNLFGTTYLGEGPTSSGSVYELTPSGTTWKETIVHAFSLQHSGDGENPSGDLIFDKAGDLIGTTSQGGTSQSYDGGVVYTLKAKNWNERVVFDFNNMQQGLGPAGGVIFGASGDLYGTTEFGYQGGCPHAYSGCGNVFEVSLSGTETTIGLNKTYGYHPAAGLVSDVKGNLYGTTRAGGDLSACAGSDGCGSVFEILRQ
jgi:uncharacterized repeat protein (TIGR03803 family)